MTGGWVITCEHYTTRPFRTEEEAVRKVELIEECGACSLPHRVVDTSAAR